MKSKYPSEIVHVPGCSCVEFLTIKMSFAKFNCFICCVYIPSGSSQQIYLNYEEVFCNLFNVNIDINDKILIFGDFNLPHVDWIYNCDYPNVLLPLNCTSDWTNNLLYSILGNGLQQIE